MKRVVDKMIEVGRFAVVTLALLALVVAGASAAERLYQADTQPTAEELPKTASLDHNPAPEDASDQMTPHGGRPFTEPAAYLQSALAVPAGPDQHRQAFVGGECIPTSWMNSHSWLSNEAVGSTALVDSRVGHRFTLVGSKPSGTS